MTTEYQHKMIYRWRDRAEIPNIAKQALESSTSYRANITEAAQKATFRPLLGTCVPQKEAYGHQNETSGHQNQAHGRLNETAGHQNRSDCRQNETSGHQNRSHGRLNGTSGHQNRSDGQLWVLDDRLLPIAKQKHELSMAIYPFFGINSWSCGWSRDCIFITKLNVI